MVDVAIQHGATYSPFGRFHLPPYRRHHSDNLGTIVTILPDTTNLCTSASSPGTFALHLLTVTVDRRVEARSEQSGARA